MPPFASLTLRVAFIAGLVLVSGASGLLAQQRVGIHGAVNPEATGAPPGAAPKKLVIGQDVIFNERITTGTVGQTQIMFLDESGMTVGPNSDVTIDQFVYDPKSGTGRLAMSATRGVLRYVGGKLSKQDGAVTVRTSTATLAVRGGAFIMNIDRTGRTEAIFIFGEGVTITGLNGITGALRRPGFEIIVNPGFGPAAPTPVPPEHLAQLLVQLDGRTGGTGGASIIPTDAAVVSSGVPQTISGNFPVSFQEAAANQGTAAPDVQVVVPNPQQQVLQQINGLNPPASSVVVATTGPYAGVRKTGSDFNLDLPDQASSANVPFGSGALSNGTFGATVGGSLLSFPLAIGTSTFSATGSSPGGKVSGTSFLSDDSSYFYAKLNAANGQSFFVSGGLAVPSSALAATGSTRIFAFDLSAGSSPTSIPFSPQDSTGTVSKPALAPLYLVAPASTAIGDTSTTAARTLHATVSFTGQGSAQSSTALVTTGTVGTLQSSGAPIITGVLRGVESASVGGGSEMITSAVSSVVDGNGNSLYGKSTITGFTLDQTQFAAGTNGTVGKALASTATETEGVSLTQQQFPDTYGFAQPAVQTKLPTGVGTNRTTQTLTGYFGGLMESTATSTPYAITGTASIATDNVANTVNATLTSDPLTSSATGGVTSVAMNLGGKQSAFIDDNIFGGAENPATPQQINGKPLVVNGDSTQASQLYFVSSGTAALPTNLLPSGASFCQCQYLQWGYWGGDLLTGNSSDSSLSRVDQGHINTWVAGVPTPLADLNSLTAQSAKATYTGHAIGSVYNSGASYVAAGGFQGTYNFGPQTGSLTFSNFDNRTFSTGTVAVPRNGANYTFSVAGSGATVSGSGSFYGPNAAETGGNFNVQLGTTYKASGIYAGKQ